MTDDDHFHGEVTQKAVVFGPDGDVLLVRSGDRPWVIPGGRIENGEDAEAALRRELREETGLAVDVRRPVKAVTDVWYNGEGEPVFALVYYCEADERAVTLNHEHDEFRWTDPDEAADALPDVDPVVEAVERAIRARRGHR